MEEKKFTGSGPSERKQMNAVRVRPVGELRSPSASITRKSLTATAKPVDKSAPSAKGDHDG